MKCVPTNSGTDEKEEIFREGFYVSKGKYVCSIQKMKLLGHTPPSWSFGAQDEETYRDARVLVLGVQIAETYRSQKKIGSGI